MLICYHIIILRLYDHRILVLLVDSFMNYDNYDL
jgi:hypothetical protein